MRIDNPNFHRAINLFLLFCIPYIAVSQHHNVSAGYLPPSDPLVQQNLAEWQDLKFGLFMHWGTYSQWGIVESWSLCPEDEGWTVRRGPHAQNYFDYVKAYENLQTTFNPTRFDPEKWADAAKQAGMKYVVFTTKHHDGFAMFDTQQSDYKITDPKTPFSSNPKANVTKGIFDAFRTDGFRIGAYFSKPDWHSDDYWWPYFPPKDRNVNYDPTKYPERWENFKNFTYNQIEELMTDYGRVDILWLDGGWVRPFATIDTTVEWQRTIKVEQDIDMARIAKMARGHQPGLLIVDRTVPGAYENYVTPEQQVPSEPLDIPWESCLTLGNSWSYVPNDTYKPARQVIHTLIKIVSRGGNYLLNIGPGPDGDWAPDAYDRLKAVGEWMALNGEGIYGTRTVTPYAQDRIFYTQHKDGRTSYAFLLSDDDSDSLRLPSTFQLSLPGGKPVKRVEILGVGKVPFRMKERTVEIDIPSSKRTHAILRYAAAVKLSH